MDINKAYNFKTVDELLTCSGTLKNVNLQSLAEDDYEVVINLLPNEDKYAIQGEKREIEELGILYFYIPVDWDEPKGSDFKSFESAMHAVKGRKVHVHCAANFRATAFYAIYAVKNQGWSKTQLSEFISSIWQLSKYPHWEQFVSSHTNSE